MLRACQFINLSHALHQPDFVHSPDLIKHVQTKGSPISKAPVKRHSTTYTRHCRLSTEPHQSPFAHRARFAFPSPLRMSSCTFFFSIIHHECRGLDAPQAVPSITMSSYLCGGMLQCTCFSRRASRETSHRTAHYGCCCYRESDRKSDLSRLVPCASGPLLPLLK